MHLFEFCHSAHRSMHIFTTQYSLNSLANTHGGIVPKQSILSTVVEYTQQNKADIGEKQHDAYTQSNLKERMTN